MPLLPFFFFPDTAAWAGGNSDGPMPRPLLRPPVQVVDWLFSRQWYLAEERRMHCGDETVHHAVRLFDGFLSRRNADSFLSRHPCIPEATLVRPTSREFPDSCLPAAPLPPEHLLQGSPAIPQKLQRLAATCLLVAAKLNELQAYRRPAREFAVLSEAEGFDTKGIVLGERALLKVDTGARACSRVGAARSIHPSIHLEPA